MTDNPSAAFRELSEELCSLIEKEGLAVRPYDHWHLPYFLRLNLDAQVEILTNLNSYLEICRKVMAEKSSLKDAVFFIKKALEHYRYSCDPRIFEFASEESVSEIYNLRHTQIFRTLTFFEHTSYTIEDIYCRQWLHLYDREPHVGAKMYTYAETLLKGGKLTTVIPDIEEHVVTEKASLEKIESLVGILCISTLVQDNAVRGLFAALSSRPITLKSSYR